MKKFNPSVTLLLFFLVACSSTPDKASVLISSPTGNEVWGIGSNQVISWDAKNWDANDFLVLTLEGEAGGEIVCLDREDFTKNQCAWAVEGVLRGDIVAEIEPGKYTLTARLYDDLICTTGEGCDQYEESPKLKAKDSVNIVIE
ncbi:MAG: hypothetical protein WC777_04445 [Candidatus Gracilibacteria bacterium]|jgi:hypothetical protein